MMDSHTWLTTHPIAHRGLWSREREENSLAAFVAARDAGYPIELDVHMIADGTLVVFHDWHAMRMCGVNMDVAGYTQTSWHKLRFTTSQQRPPLLADVLHAISGKVPILIEMKYRGRDRRAYIHALYAQLAAYNGAYALSTFNPWLLKAAKAVFSEVLCGQNFSDYPHCGRVSALLRRMSMLCMWKMCGIVPDFFACRATMLPETIVVSWARKYKIPLIAWGIRDYAHYEKVKDVINNEIFDHQWYGNKR